MQLQMAINHLSLGAFDWDQTTKNRPTQNRLNHKNHFFLILETNAISVNLVVNERNCNSQECHKLHE